eukprot:CAMPEP_0205879604 /NCGR_PEP_ID=MMETSP1083-20121108/15482_1 /ASSEMBLY_ACC=CAM_ASM_000430 /TAXON_ID=97485 /ORGANISM="Prymnesium parvum, Strain Texoma1" /LENGTH=31 /DNA_ID= /DNA_START= /DNA_END= /DNA_ORIENTATION=
MPVEKLEAIEADVVDVAPRGEEAEMPDVPSR